MSDSEEQKLFDEMDDACLKAYARLEQIDAEIDVLEEKLEGGVDVYMTEAAIAELQETRANVVEFLEDLASCREIQIRVHLIPDDFAQQVMNGGFTQNPTNADEGMLVLLSLVFGSLRLDDPSDLSNVDRVGIQILLRLQEHENGLLPIAEIRMDVAKAQFGQEVVDQAIKKFFFKELLNKDTDERYIVWQDWKPSDFDGGDYEIV